MFNGPWNDDEDLTSHRVGGLIPAQLNGVGSFDEDLILGLLAKPVSALEDIVYGDLRPFSDRIIRDIRNYDYRHEGGSLIYRVELVPSNETIEFAPSTGD